MKRGRPEYSSLQRWAEAGFRIVQQTLHSLQEIALEKGKATHSSILARRIPWTVEPMGSRGHKASDMTE